MSYYILDKLYEEINDSSIDNNVNSYFNIIQIKDSTSDLRSHRQALYVDIKRFIECYVNSIEKRDFGYDVLNVDKIILAINCISISKERLSLFLHTYKILKNNNFENEAENIIVNIRKTKLDVLRTEKSKRKHLNVFLHLISYNLMAVFFVLILLFFVSYIIFLPTSKESFAIIDFQYKDFQENFYVNHLLNVICYLFDISDDVQINPINWRGVLLMGIMKLFYVICIINYFYKVILERLKLNK